MALVAGLAHEAETVLGLRVLRTGFAGDVSGVVRVGRGGGGDEYRYDHGCDHGYDHRNRPGSGRSDEGDEGSEDGQVGAIEGREMLYYIGAGGDVKIV